MKKYLYSLVALLSMGLCLAQSAVTQAEYFWDTDPGAGLGTAIQAADGNFNSAFEQLTRTGITLPSAGLHKFCIRVKDNTGQWGPVFTNIVEVQGATTSTLSTVTQAEYFWDNDPGVGLGTPILASDGNFNSAFEQLSRTGIALPSLGLHVFNIRVKDNTGQWGPTFRNVISVQTTLGTEDMELKSVALYPNPVKDVLNLSSDTAITSVVIYNLLGQQMRALALNTTEGAIDMSGLTAGTYIVKVNSDAKSKTIKVIKQ